MLDYFLQQLSFINIPTLNKCAYICRRKKSLQFFWLLNWKEYLSFKTANSSLKSINQHVSHPQQNFMKNTMLTTHLTDMLLQVEICLPCLIYDEQSMCISNQKLLRSVKAEAELCIWVCCLFLKKKVKEENCCSQDVGWKKCCQNRPFLFNS